MKIRLVTLCIAFHFLLLLTAVAGEVQADPKFRATVRIHASENGAGIVIGKAETCVYVVTAYQVVKGAPKIGVVFHDRLTKFPAKLIRYNEKLDIALLTVSNTKGVRLPDNLPVVTISDEMKVGNKVSIVGHPDNLDWQVRYEQITQLSHLDDSRQFLCSSPHLLRGVSGGPVFDEKGFLLGLVLNKAPSHNMVAFKITEVLKVLKGWRITSSLTQQTGNQTNSVSPITDITSSFVPVTIELTRIRVLQRGGRGTVKWSYQVVLDDEQLLFKSEDVYAHAQRTGVYTQAVRTKTKAEFSRDSNHLLRIIVVGTNGMEEAKGQLNLSLQNATGMELPVPIKGILHNKESFIFYFVLKKMNMPSLPSDKRRIRVDKPFIKATENLIADLNALLTQVDKIEEETDNDKLKIKFNGWRNRVRFILGILDAHQFKLRGHPTNFKATFDKVTGIESEDSNNLPRSEVIRKLLCGADHIETVILVVR